MDILFNIEGGFMPIVKKAHIKSSDLTLDEIRILKKLFEEQSHLPNGWPDSFTYVINDLDSNQLIRISDSNIPSYADALIQKFRDLLLSI